MTQEDLFGSIAEKISTNGPIVLFRRPFHDVCEVLLPRSDEIIELKDIDELDLDTGFVFYPFDPGLHHPVYSIHSRGHSAPVRELLAKEFATTITDPPVNQNLEGSTSKIEHCERVELAIEGIKKGALKKVVLAKKKCVSFKANAFTLFQRALKKYPGAFVHLTRLPEQGVWIGASPELLLSVDEGRARIDSLAATKKLGKQSVEAREWSEKELDEQRIVTEYIDKILTDQDIETRSWSTPKDQRAGDLVHLVSTVKFDLKWGTNRTMALLKSLHPTPAVCGTPKQQALEFIKGAEDFDRAYYTGFLGPVHKNGRTDLFVNLRCMHIVEDRVEIFAGGGITGDSIPEAEWTETEHKCDTMLDLLF